MTKVLNGYHIPSPARCRDRDMQTLYVPAHATGTEYQSVLPGPGSGRKHSC